MWLQVLFALHDATLLSGMQLAGVTTKDIEPIHTGRSRVDMFLELLSRLRKIVLFVFHIAPFRASLK